ncbi:serine/threonine-protein phosphatase 6 regulatory ankyrin repeat subunit B-like [Venturia nashicola]|nr:serine/threonine-protein phosphatase 6 regulatory ankyrin repeat subunit B-like [Venturia nashicola]
MDPSPSPKISGVAIPPNNHKPPPPYFQNIAQSPQEHEDTNGGSTKVDSYTESGQLAISSLLAAGFDPHNMPYKKPYKAFRWACEEGNEAVVQWLLPEIKNVDSVIDTDFRAAMSGLTGLHRASQAGHVSVVSFLLQQGANIEAVATSGTMTPLMLAASNGKDKVIRELLLHGAEPLPRTAYNKSALFHAIKEGHEDCVRELLESPPEIDIWHNQGAKELDKACQLGNPVLIKLLLEKGARFELRRVEAVVPYDTGFDHLYRASRDNSLAVIQVLLEAGIDVNGVSSNGTALSAAAKAGHVDMAQLLIRNGARLNFKGKSSQTPLEIARKHKHYEVVRVLKESAESARQRALVQHGKSTVW